MVQISKYEAQAQQFLTDTGTKVTVTFLRFGPYFENDKESRSVYRVTFSRNGTRFSFPFGQSIIDSRTNTPPSTYDVLTCLEKYDPDIFENWCADTCYDSDSRMALATYRKVKAAWKKVSGFFTETELEQLREIE